MTAGHFVAHLEWLEGDRWVLYVGQNGTDSGWTSRTLTGTAGSTPDRESLAAALAKLRYTVAEGEWGWREDRDGVNRWAEAPVLQMPAQPDFSRMRQGDAKRLRDPEVTELLGPDAASWPRLLSVVRGGLFPDAADDHEQVRVFRFGEFIGFTQASKSVPGLRNFHVSISTYPGGVPWTVRLPYLPPDPHRAQHELRRGHLPPTDPNYPAAAGYFAPPPE